MEGVLPMIFEAKATIRLALAESHFGTIFHGRWKILR
jgi:hypothetical protein